MGAKIVFEATTNICTFSCATVQVLPDGKYTVAVLDDTGKWQQKVLDRHVVIGLAFKIHAAGLNWLGDAFIMTGEFFRSQATEEEWILAALENL